jgi:hypothetical protein
VKNMKYLPGLRFKEIFSIITQDREFGSRKLDVPSVAIKLHSRLEPEVEDIS